MENVFTVKLFRNTKKLAWEVPFREERLGRLYYEQCCKFVKTDPVTFPGIVRVELYRDDVLIEFKDVTQA
jgi:hypothetical protein